MTSHPVGPFQVGDKRKQLRTAFGACGLIKLGEPILSGLARWSPPRSLHLAVRLWSRATISYLNIEVDLDGIEHIDPNEQYLVAPLHEGFADPLLLSRLPIRARYLVRDELFEWRHLGRFLRASGQVEVATESGGRDTRAILRQTRAVTRSGDSLVVFPQGSILGIEVAFTKGAFLLADRLSLPLLPVVITGTHRVWEHPYGPTLRYGQQVSMTILPSIPVGEALASKADIESEMKDLALANTVAPARRFDPERDGYWDGYDYEIDPRFPELAELVRHHRAGLDQSSVSSTGRVVTDFTLPPRIKVNS
jgi:1-acyl-sn-glycerol-3-phosphate acyltransferase